MSTLTYRHGDTSPLPSGWLARIASGIAGVWSRCGRKRHAWVMSADLQALDDRMLKDIGLQRCGIERALLHGERLEWYIPLADTVWAMALIPQSSHTLPGHLADRRNSHD